MALTNALAWSLELLLDDDGVEQPTVTTLLNLYCGGDVRLLPKVSQCRLLLRLVHDTAAGLPPDLADHFASLAAWSREDPSGFPPGVSLAQICPQPELVARVRAAPGRLGQRVARLPADIITPRPGEDEHGACCRWRKPSEGLGRAGQGLRRAGDGPERGIPAGAGAVRPRPCARIHLAPRRAALLLLARWRGKALSCQAWTALSGRAPGVRRRNNLFEAIQSGSFSSFELPAREALTAEVLQYVAVARQALGPPFLKVRGAAAR